MNVEVADLTAGALDRAVYELLRQRLTERLPVVAPAAGADWAQVVPADEIWELLAVRFQLTTSAVVANRAAVLRVLDAGGAEAWRIDPQAVQPASIVQRYTYLPGIGYSSGVVQQQLGLPSPPALLLAGETIGSVTSAIDAGDAYVGVELTVTRWSLNRMAQRISRLERTNWPL